MSDPDQSAGASNGPPPPQPIVTSADVGPAGSAGRPPLAPRAASGLVPPSPHSTPAYPPAPGQSASHGYAPARDYVPVPTYPPGPGLSAAPDYLGAVGWTAQPPAPRSRALGLTSMLIAIPLFVLSVIASAVVGVSIGPFATRTGAGFSYNSSDLPAGQAASLAPVGILMVAQILVGTALGILALVLGIVAVATKRGRPLGIVGIVVSVAAPIVSFAVYLACVVSTLPPA